MRWAVIVAASVVAGLLWNMAVKYMDDAEKRNRNTAKAISNCRQIITALHAYAADHDGKYPDAFLTNPQSSNEVFRKLFEEGVTDHEPIFGCPVSPFVPDGAIIAKQQFMAVGPGENHWAMTTGLSDTMAGAIPLVYENPVSGTAWPPRWNGSAKDTSVRGRAWSQGVVVGRNDGSVKLEQLASRSGTSVGLRKGDDGKDPFEAAIDPVKLPKGVVLDVLKKK